MANGEGPGGGEYYCGEHWDNQEPSPITRDHHETALGAVAINPSTGQLAATVYDPIDKISQGVGTGTAGGASEYTIRIRSVRGVSPQAPLVGRLLTFSTGDASTGSDGVASGDDATAVIPHAAIAHAGDNDHRFDFGFRPRTDWGDGPNQTSLADNGPRHIIVPGLFIGSGVQDDVTGTATSLDNGDNMAGEEDGPTGPINLTPGRPTAVTIRVTNTTGATATLWGWIDLNGNGTFRHSTDPASGAPTGLAQDGEVEDHLVSVLAAGTLPKTGRPMLTSLALATALLLGGVTLLHTDRRRRNPAPIPVPVRKRRQR